MLKRLFSVELGRFFFFFFFRKIKLKFPGRQEGKKPAIPWLNVLRTVQGYSYNLCRTIWNIQQRLTRSLLEVYRRRKRRASSFMEPRITRDYQVDIIAYVLPGDLNNTKPPVTIVSFLKIYLRRKFYSTNNAW